MERDAGAMARPESVARAGANPDAGGIEVAAVIDIGVALPDRGDGKERLPRFGGSTGSRSQHQQHCANGRCASLVVVVGGEAAEFRDHKFFLGLQGWIVREIETELAARNLNKNGQLYIYVV
jgi:hypothetical protein